MVSLGGESSPLYLNHVAVVWSADLFRHFLAPSVGLVVPGGTLYVGCVTLRLKPSPADGLPRGSVLLGILLAFL